MPLPGTPLFDSAMEQGYLPREWDPDKMNWTKANMINLAIPPDELEEIRRRAWVELNDSSYVQYKKGMDVTSEVV